MRIKHKQRQEKLLLSKRLKTYVNVLKVYNISLQFLKIYLFTCMGALLECVVVCLVWLVPTEVQRRVPKE